MANQAQSNCGDVSVCQLHGRASLSVGTMRQLFRLYGWRFQRSGADNRRLETTELVDHTVCSDLSTWAVKYHVMLHRKRAKFYSVVLAGIVMLLVISSCAFHCGTTQSSQTSPATQQSADPDQALLDSAHQDYLHSAEAGPNGKKGSLFERMGILLDRYSRTHNLTDAQVINYLGAPDLVDSNRSGSLYVYFYYRDDDLTKRAMHITFDPTCRLENIIWSDAAANDYSKMQKYRAGN
jgi:hypothetical protein